MIRTWRQPVPASRAAFHQGGSGGGEPGAGSTFWCVIPLGSTDQRVAADAPAPHFDGLRVLIVDDTPINRSVLIGQLGSWGMRPEEHSMSTGDIG